MKSPPGCAYDKDIRRLETMEQTSHEAMLNTFKQATTIFTFTRHTSVVWSLAISPDGQSLVSGDADGIIRVQGVH